MAAAQKPGRPKGLANKQQGEDVRLSKSLSWLLRHGAKSVGISLLPGGYVYVEDVLGLPQFSRYTVDQVQQVVDNNVKKRFALALDPDTGKLKIRANQGHSIQVDDLELTPIQDATEAPVVVHGTKMAAWQQIKSQGLSRMGRNHIHFAAGEPGTDGVISGMRGSSEVMIYLDVDKALAAGVKLLRSANNVLLSSGIDGVISPSLFSKVIHRTTGKDLLAEISGFTETLPDVQANVRPQPGASLVVSAEDMADEMDRKKRRKKKQKQPEDPS